ncbi:MAG: hypothetical protein ABI557_22045, partial [Aureliella sp.]
LLQPNSLPVNVRLLLHWRVDENRTMSVTLPRLLNASSAHDALHLVDNQLSDERVRIQAPLVSGDNLSAEIIQRWGELLVTAWPTANNRPSEQTLAWLMQWHPQLLGLAKTASLVEILSSAKLQTLVPELASELNSFDAEELWQQLWLQSNLRQSSNNQPSAEDQNGRRNDRQLSDRTEILRDQEIKTPADLQTELAAREVHWTSRPSRQLLMMQGALLAGSSPLTIELEEPATDSSWSAQLSAAGFLALAALLVHFLATRLSGSYMRLLANQPWVYWLQLAGLAWFLLPVSWPSWVLILTAAIMFTSQNLETRRRRRLLARV